MKIEAMTSDAETIARTSRALRRRLGLRQVDLVDGRRSRHFGRRLENQAAGLLRLDDIKHHFERMGAHARISVWWNGAALDRLLEERHAGIVERVVGVLVSARWQTMTEVTFSKWGERGSIDVLASEARSRALFVGEVKSEWGSIEETNRRLDVKLRLAPAIAEERFGWRPRLLARVLIPPDEMTARRIAAKHATTPAGLRIQRRTSRLRAG